MLSCSFEQDGGWVSTQIIIYFCPWPDLNRHAQERAQRPQRGTSTNFVTRAVLPSSVPGKTTQVKTLLEKGDL
jgi:hypothetical protein